MNSSSLAEICGIRYKSYSLFSSIIRKIRVCGKLFMLFVLVKVAVSRDILAFFSMKVTHLGP